MTVYIDELRTYERRGALSGEWCHMVADSTNELMRFADKVGIPRAWAQLPDKHRHYAHFDLRRSYRIMARRAGALEVSTLQLARYMNTGKWEAPTAGNRARWERIDRLGARDGWLCALCGQPLNVLLPPNHPLAVTFDHVIPRSNRGIMADENLQLAHKFCNNKRGNKPMT